VIEAVTLAAGLGLTVGAVHIAKSAEDRPRPSDSLVSTNNPAYPSGHAAYAIAWVALAVVAVRVGRGPVSRTAVVTAAVAVAVIVGATRVYLRAHYLSDVVGGWALAAAIFALCGMVALVVAFVRHNARSA
jgi:undecaprenyl-diphosphatase